MANRRTYNGGGVGYSTDALDALMRGQYREYSGNRQSKYHTSQEQLEPVKSLPVLNGLGSSNKSDWRSNFSTDRARQKYAERINYSPMDSSNDDNYVVKRDRYNKLMQNGRLADDIGKLSKIFYENANQDATISEDYAYGAGAMGITGGYTKDQFIDTLSRRYDLTPKELVDMATTYHADKRERENAQAWEEFNKFGESLPVLGSVFSLAGTLGSGIEGLWNTGVGAITNDDRYLSTMFRTAKNAPREGVKKNIESGAGKTAYDITMGIGDMAVGTAAGSAPVILAGNTANEAMNSALERGSNVRKSAGYGAIAGTLDYFTNKVGLEKAKKLAVDSIKGTGIKKFLARNAAAGVGEGFENILQDLGQTFVDEVINKKNSELSKSYDNKIANGMSAEEAYSETAKEYVKQLLTSGGIGFGMGSAMQAGKSAFSKVPEVEATKPAETQELPKVENTTPQIPVSNNSVEVPDFAKLQADWEAGRAANKAPEVPTQPKNYKIDTVNLKGGKKGYYVSESIDGSTTRNVEPGKVYRTEAEALDAMNKLNNALEVPVQTNNVEVPKPAEPKIEDNPRFVKALEGEELNNAKAQKKANQSKINAYKNEIKLLKEDPKNKYRGNLKKAVQNEIKAKEAEIRKLQSGNKDLDMQMKGGLKPVKDMLSKEQKNAIYDTSGKYDSVFSKINFAVKFAGDTPEAKALAKQAQNAIREYINTGSSESAKALMSSLTELDNMAKTVNAEWTSSKGNKWTYDQRFGDQASYLSGLQPVYDIYRAEKAAGTGTSTPKTPAPETPSNPRIQEIDDRLAQIDEKLNQYGESNTNDAETESIKAEIRAYDQQIKDIEENGIHIDINGQDTRLDARSEQARLSELRVLREQARNRLEKASAMPVEDAVAGNVRRQLEQARERLLQEKESIQNGGGDNGNVPPKTPEPPFEDINRVPTEEAPVDNGGNVPPNEPPKPPVPPEEPPTPDNPETSLSRRYNTIMNSDLIKKSEANAKMVETAKDQGVFNKDVESRKKSQAEAVKEYVENPEEVTKKNFDKDWDSGKDVDTAMLVLQDALDSGSQAYANLALLKQAIQGKKAGRVLRGMRDYAYSGTKEGTLSKVGDYLVDKAEKVLKNKKANADYTSMAESIKKGDMSVLDKLNMDETNIKRIRDAVANGASAEDIKTMLAMYKAVGTTGISDEALAKVNEIHKEMENLPPTSKARADLEADVFKVLADDVGGKRTWREQWDAWRYLAMLGNPKTHLRNILGNTMHRMVTETKDNVGAVIEEAVDKINRKMGGEGIERTKALLNADDEGLIDLAKQDADNVAYASLNDTGNKYNIKNEIDRARDAFNSKKLSKLEEFNSNMLDLEDYSALKNKYSKSLARFLKANGADESIFEATDDASKALLDKARAYAVDQAKQATFHEYSKLAEALTQFSQKMQSDGKLSHKAAGYVLEGLVPFKKTPINILKQGAKYSPVELVKSIGKIYDAAKNGGSVSDAIESLASGLTGSGIYALGAFLASQGILTGSAEDNYSVDNAQTEQGEQNYAIKIGNNSYTLDWLAPFALPLFAGAETYKLMTKEHGDSALDAVIDGLTAIAEPVTEMSMLQGINNTLESLSYSGVKSAIGTFGASALTGYLTQGVPTLAGQVARTFDNTRRSTYSDQDSAVRRQMDKALTKVQNKLPFLSMDSQPYIDSRGQAQQNEGLFSYYLGDNIGTRLADQMLSPGYFKEGTVTDVDRELNRLYQETGESAYRKVSDGKIKDVRLSKEDYTKYQSLYGQTTDELYDNIIKSKDYNSLDNAEKVKMLNDAQKVAKNLSDLEIGGRELEKSEQKLVDIYKEEGADGVTKYLGEKAAADSLGLNHDTYVKKQAEFPGGAAAYAKMRDQAKVLGLDTDTYIKQENENPRGAQGYLQDKEDAVTFGYVDKDGKPKTADYEKARGLFGDDDYAIRKNQEFKTNGITKAFDKVPELINDNTLSNESKGKLLVGDAKSLTGAKKDMYDMGGYEGAYYYYLIKSLADADGNGNVKKAERQAYFEGESQYLDDLWALNHDMYMYLMQNLK